MEGICPNFGHAFSNCTHFRTCGRFRLSSVQSAAKVDDGSAVGPSVFMFLFPSMLFYLLQQRRKQKRWSFKDIASFISSLYAFVCIVCFHDTGHINSVLRKSKRYRFTDAVLTFSELLEQSDEQLFTRVVCTNHCLFHLLRKNSLLQTSLRPMGHSFYLHSIVISTTDQKILYFHFQQFTFK